MLASGTSIIGTFGMFMLPILKEFGWGRARISGVVMAMSCTTALLAPLFGRLFDRWGVRRIVLPGIVLFASAVMLLSLASGSVAQFYFLFFLVGVSASFISIVPFTKVVSSWFDKQRGVVLAFVGAGVSLGAAVLPHIARYFIAHWGWRFAYIGIGLVILAINLPVQFFWLREGAAASSTNRAPAGEKRQLAEPNGMSAARVRRAPTYWVLIAIIFLTTFAVGGISPHMAPLMIGRGLSAQAAASTLSMYVLGGVGGRLLMGKLLDCFRTPRVALPFYLAAVAGVILLQAAHSATVFALSGVLIGICLGAEGEMAPFLLSRYFGLKSFAEIYALLFLFLAFANGVAPVAVGAVFDATGSYRIALHSAGAVLAVSAALFCLLGPYRFDNSSASSAAQPSADEHPRLTLEPQECNE